MASANEKAASALSQQIGMQIVAARINGLSSQLQSANSIAIARATERGTISQVDMDLIGRREEVLARVLEELDKQLGL